MTIGEFEKFRGLKSALNSPYEKGLRYAVNNKLKVYKQALEAAGISGLYEIKTVQAGKKEKYCPVDLFIAEWLYLNDEKDKDNDEGDRKKERIPLLYIFDLIYEKKGMFKKTLSRGKYSTLTIDNALRGYIEIINRICDMEDPKEFTLAFFAFFKFEMTHHFSSLILFADYWKENLQEQFKCPYEDFTDTENPDYAIKMYERILSPFGRKDSPIDPAENDNEKSSLDSKENEDGKLSSSQFNISDPTCRLEKIKGMFETRLSTLESERKRLLIDSAENDNEKSSLDSKENEDGKLSSSQFNISDLTCHHEEIIEMLETLLSTPESERKCSTNDSAENDNEKSSSSSAKKGNEKSSLDSKENEDEKSSSSSAKIDDLQVFPSPFTLDLPSCLNNIFDSKDRDFALVRNLMFRFASNNVYNSILRAEDFRTHKITDEDFEDFYNTVMIKWGMKEVFEGLKELLGKIESVIAGGSDIYKRIERLTDHNEKYKCILDYELYPIIAEKYRAIKDRQKNKQ